MCHKINFKRRRLYIDSPGRKRLPIKKRWLEKIWKKYSTIAINVLYDKKERNISCFYLNNITEIAIKSYSFNDFE